MNIFMHRLSIYFGDNWEYYTYHSYINALTWYNLQRKHGYLCMLTII